MRPAETLARPDPIEVDPGDLRPGDKVRMQQHAYPGRGVLFGTVVTGVELELGEPYVEVRPNVPDGHPVAGARPFRAADCRWWRLP